ncbi:hypothetical protein K435DRAFT_746322 [Dendrothele bispora CBS 962.96]|uniref:Transmembrane protein 135 N-terminal domain-containing protein n=1 Tax=Dendrothele bispora (strain CBS 962.96) TaxID=1314807 RepID=A0A4S8MPU5_DENBC|nr:hypothetical protein K435DRAFT_746322 [Dendrothele bispora CBS 962.96]
MSRSPSSSSWLERFSSQNASHPTQIALRTYALGLSLSLGPSLLPFVTALLLNKPSKRTGRTALLKVLRRELGIDGFAFAMTFAVWGGSSLSDWWAHLEACSVDQHENTEDKDSGKPSPIRRVRAWISYLNSKLQPRQKTFLSYIIPSFVCVLLLQAGRRPSKRTNRSREPVTFPIPYTPLTPSPPSEQGRVSPTLDLTLLLVVRALDVVVQQFVMRRSEILAYSRLKERQPQPERLREQQIQEEKVKKRMALTTSIDALLFWACSARIMWCFFYEPQRLPRSYVKWINSLASVDSRLLRALQLIRERKWSYIHGSPSHPSLLTSMAADLKLPARWGDPLVIPAFGSDEGNKIWESLGVKSRAGVGGIPCEIVHGGVGSTFGLAGSCTANATLRGMTAFVEAFAIYFPVHLLPILLTRPRALLRPHRASRILVSSLRSSAFLSAFISLFWSSVCITRTTGLARLFPSISHDFWDGPYGCILAGCLMCGSSIWIEHGHRRGEMALYVLPRAIRACIPFNWIKNPKARAMAFERLAFVLSLSSLLTASRHHPEALRGVARWALTFMMNGPRAGFWQRKRQALDTTRPPSPSSEDNTQKL